MNGASPVLSLSYRMRPRWWTIVPTTDRYWVRSNSPNIPLSNFLQVSTNGHMRQTVVPTTVHPAQPFWLSETLFLRASHFFSHFPLFWTFEGHTPLLQPIFFPVILQIPKSHHLLVGSLSCWSGCLLDHQVPFPLVFLKFSGMCL